jgi:hypothetical protein
MEGQKVITRNGTPVAVLGMPCTDGKSFLLRPTQVEPKDVVAFRMKVIGNTLSTRKAAKTTLDALDERVHQRQKLAQTAEPESSGYASKLKAYRTKEVKSEQVPDNWCKHPSFVGVVDSISPTAIIRGHYYYRGPDSMTMWGGNGHRLDYVDSLSQDDRIKLYGRRPYRSWKSRRGSPYKYPEPSFRTLEPDLIDREVDLW